MVVSSISGEFSDRAWCSQRSLHPRDGQYGPGVKRGDQAGRASGSATESPFLTYSDGSAARGVVNADARKGAEGSSPASFRMRSSTRAEDIP